MGRLDEHLEREIEAAMAVTTARQRLAEAAQQHAKAKAELAEAERQYKSIRGGNVDEESPLPAPEKPAPLADESIHARVRGLIVSSPGRTFTTPDVAKALGLTADSDQNFRSLRGTLSRLVKAGEIVRGERGIYMAPPTNVVRIKQEGLL